MLAETRSWRDVSPISNLKHWYQKCHYFAITSLEFRLMALQHIFKVIGYSSNPRTSSNLDGIIALGGVFLQMLP